MIQTFLKIQSAQKKRELYTPGFVASNRKSVPPGKIVIDTRKFPFKRDSFEIEKETLYDKDGLEFPQKLLLRVQIIPIPLDNTHTTAEYIYNHVSFGSYPFYHPSRTRGKIIEKGPFLPFQGLKLKLIEDGSFIWLDLRTEVFLKKIPEHGFSYALSEDAILYTHSFLYQTGDKITVSALKRDRDIYISPPDRPNIIPVYCYGGVYTKALALHEIEQTYAILNNYGEGTIYEIFTASEFLNKSIVPPCGKEKYIFMDSFQEKEVSSLASRISNGEILFSLQASEEERVSQEYRSIRFTPVGNGNEFIDILFIIKE